MRLPGGRTIVPADLKADANSFTLLRWILASTVMFSHGWDLTQPARGLDPSVAILSFPVSRLAVFLFFSLSGFLVAGSLAKRGPLEFALARALRLLPGLWVMLLIVPLLLWAGFGTMPFTDFVTHPQTLRFVGRNAVLLGEFQLPGLFADHPQPGNANGSLWTIPIEVRCYIVLALVGAIGLLLPRWRLTTLLFLGFAVHLVLPADAVPLLTNSRALAFSFFIGVLAWSWRDRLWLSWPLAVLLVAGALALPADAGIKVPAMQVSLAYMAACTAFIVPKWLKNFSHALPDYSYGIYIYAFPAQQAAFALGAETPAFNIALGFALTLPFAAASWHAIEKPALDSKGALMSWAKARRAA